MDNDKKNVTTTINTEQKSDISFIFNLLLQYNEQTRKIVEELIGEIREVRGGAENYVVLENRLSSLEIRLKDVANECKLCANNIRIWIDDLKVCQNINLEKFHDFEKDAIKEHMKIREEIAKNVETNLKELKSKYDDLKDKMNLFDKDATGKYFDLDKKLSINIAKVSSVVIIVFWILKFISEKLFSHLIK